MFYNALTTDKVERPMSDSGINDIYDNNDPSKTSGCDVALYDP